MRGDRGLLLIPSDRMGGAERVLMLVGMELLRRGWELDVLCLSRGTGAIFSKMASDPKCNLYVLSDSREIFGVFAAFRLFLGVLRRRRYAFAFSSLVHCNGFLGFLRLCGLLKTNILACRESTIIANRFRGRKRFFYWCCYLFYGPIDLVICQTQEMKDVLSRFASFVNKRKLRVIPNPVGATTSIRVCRDMVAAPSFVSLGRLIYEKGFHVLLDAFALLLEEEPSAQLKIFGDGPLKESLLQRILELGLEESVHLCGVTSAPSQEMADADVCVVSSIMEGFPNVLLEMMQANCRVVSTICADGIDDIRGLLTCPTKDPIGLFEAMRLAIREPAAGRGILFDDELSRRTPSAFVDSLTASFCTGDKA